MAIATHPTAVSGRAASGLRAIVKMAREAPLLAVVILGPMIVVALLADVLAPYDPTLPVQGAEMFVPPFWMAGGSASTPLGTDFLGRDIFAAVPGNGRGQLAERLGIAPAAVVVEGRVP